MINLFTVLFGRYQSYGFDVLSYITEDVERSLAGVVYDGFGHRVFVNLLYFQWRFNL